MCTVLRYEPASQHSACDRQLSSFDGLEGLEDTLSRRFGASGCLRADRSGTTAFSSAVTAVKAGYSASTAGCGGCVPARTFAFPQFGSSYFLQTCRLPYPCPYPDSTRVAGHEFCFDVHNLFTNSSHPHHNLISISLQPHNLR